MRIIINNKQKQLGDQAVLTTRQRISNAFSKFGNQLISVELTPEDINGPRGGLDKECRVIVRLNKRDSVTVAARQLTFSKAITQAVNRAQKAVTRRLQRRSMRNSDRRNALSFPFSNR